MRKTIVIVLLCMLFVPMMVRGQEESLWELTQVATVDELGITFNIPDAWVTNGFMFAEDEGDLDAITDSEDSTQPSGYVIFIYGLPLTANDDRVPLVEDAVNEFLLSNDAEISEYQYGVVNLRPSISLNFIGSDETVNLFTFWVQDSTLLTLQLITPNQTVDSQLAFTWEQITNSVRPILADDFEFADEPYTTNELGFDISYPDGWTIVPSETGIGIFEFQEDSQNLEDNPTGLVIGVFHVPFEGAGLSDDATLDDVRPMLMYGFGLISTVDEGDYVIDGLAGIGVTGNDSRRPQSGFYIVTLNADEHLLTVYVLSAPNAEALTTATPIFLTMLQSIQPLED